MKTLKEMNEIIEGRKHHLERGRELYEEAEKAFDHAAQVKAKTRRYLVRAKISLEEALREKYELELMLERQMGSVAESIEKIFGSQGLELIRRQILESASIKWTEREENGK